MMSTVNVNPKIMKRIQEHAEQNGCSVDELLTLWLGASEKEQTSILPFRNLLDQSPDIVALFDRDGRHLYVNPAIELVNSLTPDQMIGKTNRELSMPEDLVRYWEDVHRTILQNGAQHIIRFDFPTARGTRYYESVLTPLPGEDGSIEHILGVTRDVTSRVLAEETLKEERQLFISGPAVMFQWEDKPGWPVRYVSPNFEELFGYAPIEFMQERVPFSTIIHPLDLQGVTAEFSTYAREKKPFFQQEYRLRHKNGQYRWVREFTVVARDLQGRVKYYQGHLHDITEQREAQITLDEHHSQMNAFFESALDLLCIATLDGHFVRVNKMWEHILGYSLDSLEGSRFLDLVHPDDLEATHEALKDLSQGRPILNFVNRYRAKDGHYHYIEWRTQPHKGMIYASARDITEQRKMEVNLRKSEARLRGLIQAVPDLMFRQALDGTYLDYHAPHREMMAIPPEVFMGKKTEEVLPDHLKGPISALFKKVVETGEPAQAEYPMDLHGQTHFFETRFVLSDEDEVVTIVRDVTQRKQAEQYALDRERLSANLKKEQEINALIQHAVATLSHDIRTPLAVIATTKDILNLYYDQLSDEKRLEKLNTIEKQLRFVVEMLDDLVMVVKGSLDHRTFQPRPVNLKTLCEVSMEEIRVTSGENHRMVFDCKCDMETVLVDETLVSRMLLNLLSNAVKYSPVGSEIRLQVQHNQDAVILRIMDQGIGIAAEDLQHVFKPFFRVANAPAAGSGLGLSIVHDCVERHLGKIEVESELGRGSTFTIHLPKIRKS